VAMSICTMAIAFCRVTMPVVRTAMDMSLPKGFVEAKNSSVKLPGILIFTR
jgi:hypothetical protein